MLFLFIKNKIPLQILFFLIKIKAKPPLPPKNIVLKNKDKKIKISSLKLKSPQMFFLLIVKKKDTTTQNADLILKKDCPTIMEMNRSISEERVRNRI